MAQLAGNYDDRQEYWKPAVPLRSEAPDLAAKAAVCDRCGADFLTAARFCHVCGAERNAVVINDRTSEKRTWLDFSVMQRATGQTISSLIALVLGVVCLITAAITGFIYTATTVLDWQAVQIWRIEWLLASLAMFAAGILLKKR